MPPPPLAKLIVLTVDCPADHNIITSVVEFDSADQPGREKELEEEIRGLVAHLKTEIKAGIMPPECPTCGATKDTWVIVAAAVKERFTFADVHAHMKEHPDTDEERTKKARAAYRARHGIH